MTSSKRLRNPNNHHKKSVKKDWLKNTELHDTVVRILNHLVGFAVNGGGLAWDVMYLSRDGESVWEYGGYGGKFKHITFWNQIIQSVYFGLALLNDFAGSNVKTPRARSTLQVLRDGLFTTIAWPMGLFVVVTFWGIYAVDRELVFPKALDAIVPAWLNHVMHTTVIVFLLLEKLAVYHCHYSRGRGLTYTLAFAGVYQVWILWIAYHADLWVYPILEVLDLPQRVGFFAALWVVLILFYMIGEAITNSLWGKPSGKKRQ